MKTQQFQSLITKILILTVLLISTNCFAQKDGNRELPDADRIEKMVKKLAEKISLSEDQQVSIQNLYTSHYQKVAELRETHGDQKETLRKEIKALKNELNQNIISLLTDDQQTAYEEFQDSKRQRSKNPEKRNRKKIITN